MRLLLVMENSPQCHTQHMIKVMSTIAPFVPKTSTRICVTGSPIGVPTVLAKFWMEKSNARIRKKPKSEETPMEVITPIGALHDALRVSSERCAEASKPVSVY